VADWAALLDAESVVAGEPEERELANRVLVDSPGTHPWTCTDWAMRLLICQSCRAELGTGEASCLSCAGADQTRWAWDHTGMPLSMTYNEHLMRVAVSYLRAADRRRANVVAYWRLLLPFLLTGETPVDGQDRRLRTFLLAGRTEELNAAGSISAMSALPDLPWRDA